MNLEETQKRFDERFEGIYYGKNLDGSPNYPSESFKEDVKSFLYKEIKRAVAEREKEILEAVKKAEKYQCPDLYSQPDDDELMLVSDILSLLTKYK